LELTSGDQCGLIGYGWISKTGTEPVTPKLVRRQLMRVWWSMVSKAALRSNGTSKVDEPESDVRFFVKMLQWAFTLVHLQMCGSLWRCNSGHLRWCIFNVRQTHASLYCCLDVLLARRLQHSRFPHSFCPALITAKHCWWDFRAVRSSICSESRMQLLVSSATCVHMTTCRAPQYLVDCVSSMASSWSLRLSLRSSHTTKYVKQ